MGVYGNNDDQQMISSYQQSQQVSIQKNQISNPLQNNNGVTSDRQQSRSCTRQGRNNNSFQTTGQGFFKETFYRENSENCNNRINGSSNQEQIQEEGITLDKYFGSNFQVINIFNTQNEDKPLKSDQCFTSNQNDYKEIFNTKNKKIEENLDENKQQKSSKRSSKDQPFNSKNIVSNKLYNNKQALDKLKKQQNGKLQNTQKNLKEESTCEIQQYLEEQFEIHETDEEYSESNRESSIYININNNLKKNDNIRKISKQKIKITQDKIKHESQVQENLLTGQNLRQQFNTQDSEDEKQQSQIQKINRYKYNKKMRHKSYYAASYNQNNNVDQKNQSYSISSSQQVKNQSQKQQNNEIQSLNKQNGLALQLQTNGIQAQKNIKNKYLTNNTSYNTNYSTNFSSNVTISLQNEKETFSGLDDILSTNKKNKFNTQSTQQNNSSNKLGSSNKQGSQNNIGSNNYIGSYNNIGSSNNLENNNNMESNNTNINSSSNIINISNIKKRQKSIHAEQNLNTPFKSNENQKEFPKDQMLTGVIKDINLNNSYLNAKTFQQKEKLNQNLNQSANDIINSNQYPDNYIKTSQQIEKFIKNNNSKDVNKSQSPPIYDQLQPTNQQSLSRDYGQENSNNSNENMSNFINQAKLQNIITSDMIKYDQNGSGGILNSKKQSQGQNDAFKQNITSNQSNNFQQKAINHPVINSQNTNDRGLNSKQQRQRKIKYGEITDNDKDDQKQFRYSFYQTKQNQKQQQQQMIPLQCANTQYIAQASQTFLNEDRENLNIQQNGNLNSILDHLNSLPANCNHYSVYQKNRQTLNEVYKYQPQLENQNQSNIPSHTNQQDEYIQENSLRKPIKESKFLNHKEKLQELIKNDDINFVTKYAARFNLNTNEQQQLIQCGFKQEKDQLKKRVETPIKGYRNELQKKIKSAPKDAKHLIIKNKNINSQLNQSSNDNNHNYYISKEKVNVLF